MARSSFEFHLGQPQRQPARQHDADASLRFVLIGDFTGRASRGVHEPESLDARRLTAIDIDNLEDVLARLAPEVHVPLSAAGDGVAVSIRALDDFHADALYDRLELFESLRASRRRLLDPTQFAEEAARLRPATTAVSGPSISAASTATPESDAELLRRVLGQAPRDEVPPLVPPSIKIAGVDLSRLVQEIVAPYVLPKADPRQAEFVASVDEAAAGLLRRLLHAPAFQAIEAAWRQLSRLTKSLTGEGSIRLCLLDATRAELAADLSSAGENIGTAGLCRLLVDRHVTAVDGEPWGAVVVLERFGRSADDCQLLAALGAVARLAGGTLLADAAPDVVGLESWSQAAVAADWRLDDPASEPRWSALRASSVAAWIGLSAPRLLVRLPYGKSNPTERLPFDELGAGRSHDSLLWGSAALGIAELLGLAFLEDGWSMQPGQVNDLEELPPCIYEEQGEKHLQPCAEVFLSTTTGELLAARGVMPLLSYKNRHAVRASQFVSLADPPTRLAGFDPDI